VWRTLAQIGVTPVTPSPCHTPVSAAETTDTLSQYEQYILRNDFQLGYLFTYRGQHWWAIPKWGFYASTIATWLVNCCGCLLLITINRFQHDYKISLATRHGYIVTNVFCEVNESNKAKNIATLDQTTLLQVKGLCWNCSYMPIFF